MPVLIFKKMKKQIQGQLLNELLFKDLKNKFKYNIENYGIL